VTCSHHVFNVTREHGFLEGLKALKERWRKCRGGYKVEFWNSDFRIRLTDGDIADSNTIADHVLELYKTRRRNILK
jgi:hypothetical protein